MDKRTFTNVEEKVKGIDQRLHQQRDYMMNPTEKVRKIDQRVQEQRIRLMNPSKKSLQRQIKFSCCGGAALFTLAATSLVVASPILSISLATTGTIMLANASILKIKKSKS